MDWQLVDPLFARAAGDREYPATFGHSDYWDDAAFKEAVRLLIERRAITRPKNQLPSADGEQSEDLDNAGSASRAP